MFLCLYPHFSTPKPSLLPTLPLYPILPTPTVHKISPTPPYPTPNLPYSLTPQLPLLLPLLPLPPLPLPLSSSAQYTILYTVIKYILYFSKEFS